MNNSEHIPVPMPGNTSHSQTDFTAEDIQNEILSRNENGYCPCTVIATLENIHNATQNMNGIRDEDREEIETQVLDYCSADIMEFDEEILSLILQFDTPQDAYMMDLLRILDRYRHMQEHRGEDEAPLFSVSFVPNKYEGQAIAVFSFPAAYFRTLDSDGQKTQVHFLFRNEDVLYQHLHIDDDTMTQIKADAMREAKENGYQMNAGLFEEDEEENENGSLF